MTFENYSSFKIVPIYTYIDYDVPDELTSLHLILNKNEKQYEKFINKHDDIVSNIYFGNLHGLKSLINKYGTVAKNNDKYIIGVNAQNIQLKYELNEVNFDQQNTQLEKLMKNLENETHDYNTKKRNIEFYETSCKKIKETMYDLNEQIQEIKKKQKNYDISHL
jgi:hypothetical protein